MTKFFVVVILLVVFLAIFIPFASSNPDGLEKVAESLGISEKEPAWRGLMSDYSVGVLNDPYVSRLAAGVLGVILVLGASLTLGSVIAKRADSKNP